MLGGEQRTQVDKHRKTHFSGVMGITSHCKVCALKEHAEMVRLDEIQCEASDRYFGKSSFRDDILKRSS